MFKNLFKRKTKLEKPKEDLTPKPFKEWYASKNNYRSELTSINLDLVICTEDDYKFIIHGLIKEVKSVKTSAFVAKVQEDLKRVLED